MPRMPGNLGFMRRSALAVLLALTAPLAGCLSAGQWQVLKDSTGAACPVVLQAADPALKPLCLALPELEATIQDLASATPHKAGAFLDRDVLYKAVIEHRKAAHALETK